MQGTAAPEDVGSSLNSAATGPTRHPSVVPGPISAPIKWAVFASIMLGTPFVITELVFVFGFNRAVLLWIQCTIWALAARPLIASLPTVRRFAADLGSKITPLLLLFFAGVAISTAMVWMFGDRSDMGSVLAETAALLYMSLPFFLLKRAGQTVRCDRGILLICHVVLALCLYSIGSDFTGLTHFQSGGGRYFGALGDAVAWALTMPLLVYFASARFPLAAIAALALAVTGSRAPALTVLFALLLMLVFSRGRRFQYAGMITLLIVVSLYQAGMFATLLKRFSGTEFLANDRTSTAAAGIRIFLRSPVFGSGYSALSHYFPMSARRAALGILPAQTSTFVQMLSDGGLVTFVPYMAFVVVTTTAGIWLIRRSRHLPDGGVLNGVAAWVLAMLWVNQSALWFVVGSYVGPLVFAMIGLVAGTIVRLRLSDSAVQGRPYSPELARAI